MTKKDIINGRKWANDILKTVFNKKEKCSRCGRKETLTIYTTLGKVCLYCGGEIIYE